MKNIVVNGRVLNGRKNGVWRYTYEICKIIEPSVEIVTPSDNLHGVRGHYWDQVEILRHAGKKMLWSPANSGPILKDKDHTITIHDVAFFENPSWFNGRYRQYYSFMTPKAAKNCERIITVI